MKKGMWNEMGGKVRHIETKIGGGVHTGLPPAEIPDGMAAEMENLHSGVWPQLAPRPSRSATAVPPLPSGTVRYFGTVFGTTLAAVVSKNLYILEAGAWKNCGAVSDTEAGRIYAADFMDYAIFADGSGAKKYDGEKITQVGTRGKPENAKFLAVHAWHLFAASDKDKFLRYSALQNVDDWSAPENAGAEMCETTKEAAGTGLFAYGGHILYFKENAMFELYGTDPINFSLLCLSRDIGCTACASIVEIGGALYFLGRGGLYRYTGGALPKTVSLPIQKYIEEMDMERMEEVAAGTDGVRYYLALPQKDDTTRILAYDTRVGEWYVEDAVPLVGFAALSGKTYAAASDGTVYTFGEGDEKVRWMRVSAPYRFGETLFQNWHRIYVRAEVSEGAYFSVAVSPWSGGEGWRTVGTVEKSGVVAIDIPPQMQDAPQMRVRLSGEGYVRVESVEFDLRARKRSYA